MAGVFAPGSIWIGGFNVRNVRPAVRAHANANVRGFETGDPCPPSDIAGPGKHLEEVTGPNTAIACTCARRVPTIGRLYLRNARSTTDAMAFHGPTPGSTDDWQTGRAFAPFLRLPGCPVAVARSESRHVDDQTRIRGHPF